ncbi:MAG: hypothetical protein LKK08_06195 [Bacteroidales bacterium]|jgi:hypothetical protein|nr:hypothetical protein [Bacteroidales bacterium]
MVTIEEILSYAPDRFRKAEYAKRERKEYYRMIRAIRSDDKATLAFYECLGHYAGAIQDNATTFKQAMSVGITNFWINDAGWIQYKKPKIEDIEISSNKLNYAVLKISEYPNGQWSYGYDYWFKREGGGCDPSIWGPLYDTRNAAIINGLSYMENSSNTIVKRDDDQEARRALHGIAAIRDKMFQPTLF